tara:strand:- start:163 stop:690 length:528 start_codon:yes stop_codon:yes gene_type:complete
MAKISNTSVYSDIDPVLTDYFVLTDKANNLATKSCTLASVQTLFGLGITNITVTVSSTYLWVLGTQDFTLIAAPGSGYVLDVQKIMAFMDPGNVQYDFNVAAGSIDMGSVDCGTVTQATLNSATDYVASVFNGTDATETPQNTPLILSATANPTQGTGALYINITYRTLKLDSTF